jgi:hypothetical protein
MTALSSGFTSLVAEAIGLPADSFDKYFEASGESASGTKRQDKLKIAKYPHASDLGKQGSGQGGTRIGSPYLLHHY